MLLYGCLTIQQVVRVVIQWSENQKTCFLLLNFMKLPTKKNQSLVRKSSNATDGQQQQYALCDKKPLHDDINDRRFLFIPKATDLLETNN